MECASCNVVNNTERGVACRLCEKTFHVKCVKLTARLADALLNDNGIFWLCINCRKTNSNMFNLLHKTKASFNEVRKDLAAALAKLDSHEQLFHKLYLENSSPVAQKSKKSNINKKKEKATNLEKIAIPDSNIVNLINLSPLPNTTSCTTHECTTVVKYNSINSLAVPVPDASVVVRSENTHIDNEQPCCSKSIEVPLTFSRLDTAVNSNVISDTCANITRHDNNEVLTKRQSSSSFPQLRVSKPQKTIFISRLSEDTLESEIVNYIVSKSGNIPQSEISVKKFKFSYKRQISSFNIFVPAEYFDSLVKESYWPNGILVHEFVIKNVKPVKRKEIVSLKSKN